MARAMTAVMLAGLVVALADMLGAALRPPTEGNVVLKDFRFAST